MMENNIYRLVFDKEFVRYYRKLDNSLQIEGDKKIEKLKYNPREIGKPLKFFSNLYELHLRMYRIYYIIDESEVKVLLIDVEHKNKQDNFLRSLTREKIQKFLMENP